MADLFRSPVFHKIPGRKANHPDAYVNLLALREPNPSRPFHQDDWPSARPPKEVKKSDAPANMLALLQPNPAVAFKQSDWPNAKPRRLLPKPDWPVDLLTLFQPNPSQPFSQADWFRVAKWRWPAQVDAVVNLIPLQNPVAEEAPFFQTEWPRAVDPRWRAQVDAVVRLNPLYTPNPAEPFKLDDWPAATPDRGLPKPDWSVDLLALLQPNPTEPFIQKDWPKPAKAGPFQTDTFVNLLPVQNPPVVGDTPFSQGEWALAAARQLPIKSDIVVNLLPITTQLPVGKVYPPKREERTKWPKLGRRPSLKELQDFYEAAYAAKATPAREAETTPIEDVADDVVGVVRQFALRDLNLPLAIYWQGLQEDQRAYERLVALYEEFVARELDYQEDLLLAAMVAW